MKRISVLVIRVLTMLLILQLATVIPSQVEASSDTIEWKGWWTGDGMVCEISIGETVTAQVRISDEPSGYYRIRIMKDISWGPDFEVEKLEFDYDGGDHTYSLDFSPLIASGVDRTRGYYVDVCKKEWWGWAEKWKMPSSYPPRLRVLAGELWIELTEAPEGIGGGGDVEYNENALYVIAGGGKRDFWKLDLSSLSWTTLASAPEEIGHGGSMAFDGEHYMYVVRGTSLAGLQKHNDFWRYNLEQDQWENLPNTPEEVGTLGSIVYADGYVYLRPGGHFSSGFYRYDISTQTWETKDPGPMVAVETGPSTALTYDGERYIYTFQGGQNVPPADIMYDEIWRYDIWDDDWLELGPDMNEELDREDLLYLDGGLYALNEYSTYNFEFFDLSNQEWFRKPDIPVGFGIWNSIGSGASLAYDGAHYIYALNGGNNNRIWRYRIYRASDFIIPFVPVDLILVLDRSGSMSGSEMEGAKNAAAAVVDMLMPQDRVAVVSFSDIATINVQLTSNFEDAKAKIQEISAGGITSFGAGLNLAITELEERGSEDHVPAIIFMSDGHHNTAPAPDAYVQECRDKEPRIPIYTIGFGSYPSDVDEARLKWMADQTGGKYLFAPSIYEMENVFLLFSLEATGWPLSGEFIGTVAEGEMVEAGTFVVEPGTDSVRITLNWPGSDLDLVIERPDGSKVNLGTGSDNTYSGDDAKPEWVILDNPPAGTWTVRVYGKVINPHEDYVILISNYVPSTTPLVPSTYKFEYDIPDRIVVATDVSADVTFLTDEEGDIGYDGVRFKFEADGPGAVTFRVADSGGIEHTFTDSGYGGPETGFDLPAVYNETTTWMLNFDRAGDYAITFSIIEAPDGDVIADITETVDVTVETAAPAPPMVPSMNCWGIVTMIALFSVLLVWMAWRRRLAS